jgi:hypothetical protein
MNLLPQDSQAHPTNARAGSTYLNILHAAANACLEGSALLGNRDGSVPPGNVAINVAKLGAGRGDLRFRSAVGLRIVFRGICRGSVSFLPETQSLSHKQTLIVQVYHALSTAWTALGARRSSGLGDPANWVRGLQEAVHGYLHEDLFRW